MLHIKVAKGTRPDRHLCQTCVHARIIQGTVESQELCLCAASDNAVPIQVLFRVAQCSGYQEKDSNDIRRMKEQAYYIEQLPNSGDFKAVTRAQLHDYDYLQRLDRKASQSQRIRFKTVSNPRPRAKAAMVLE